MGVPAAAAPTHHDHNPGNFEDHFGDGGANPAPVLGGGGAEVPAPAAAAVIQQTPTIQQPPIIQQQPTIQQPQTQQQHAADPLHPRIDEQEMEADIREVLQARISKRSRTTYDGYLTRFIRFLFDHAAQFPDIIHPDLMGNLIIAHQEDSNRRNNSGRPYKRRTFIDTAIKLSLANIQSDNMTTHPLYLGNLSFHVLACFMKTCLMKEIQRPGLSDESVILTEGTTESNRITIRLKPSSYDGVQSSIAYLFQECNFDRGYNDTTKQLWKTIGIYKKGTRRKGARERMDLGLRTVEGKDPIPLAAYIYLATILHESSDPEMIAAHLFLLLDWNLISRAEGVVTANIEIVGLWNDALKFQIGITKTDQDGSKNAEHPFHVYSNPSNPVICPLLAFTKHLICNPRILQGHCALFEGSNQYDRLNNILRDIVLSNEHKDAFKRFGINPQYFGTHSIRKGAVTHVATGSTSCPPIASICIRANWKMPGVMNRYIKYEAAGDLYVGRCVSGRDRFKKEFAESLPYFDFSNFDSIERESKNRSLDKWIKDRMPAGGAMNDSVFGFFKACIASLAFHRVWLDNSVDTENAMRCSPYWSEPIPFAEYVTTCHPWDTTPDSPEITGLPVDVLYMAKIEALHLEMAAMKKELLEDNSRMEMSIVEKMETSLDQRSVGGDGYGLSMTINDKLDQLITKLTSPITLPPLPDTDRTVLDMMDDTSWNCCLAEEEEDIVFTIDADEEIRKKAHAAAIAKKTKQQLKERKKTGLLVGFHHGHLNPLAPMWRYPKQMNLIQMITIYQMGSPADKVTPLKYLKAPQVVHFDKHGQNLSRMRRTMCVIKHYGKLRDVWEPRNSHGPFWNGETVTRLWDEIWEDVRPFLLTNTEMGDGKPISHHKSRTAQLAWRTCHDKFSKSGVFKTLHI